MVKFMPEDTTFEYRTYPKSNLDSQYNLPKIDLVQPLIGKKPITIREFLAYYNCISMQHKISTQRSIMLKLKDICNHSNGLLSVDDLKTKVQRGKGKKGMNVFFLPPKTHKVLAAMLLYTEQKVSGKSGQTRFDNELNSFNKFIEIENKLLSKGEKEFIESLPIFENTYSELRLMHLLSELMGTIYNEIFKVRPSFRQPLLHSILLKESAALMEVRQWNNTMKDLGIDSTDILPKDEGTDKQYADSPEIKKLLEIVAGSELEFQSTLMEMASSFGGQYLIDTKNSSIPSRLNDFLLHTSSLSDALTKLFIIQAKGYSPHIIKTMVTTLHDISVLQQIFDIPLEDLSPTKEELHDIDTYIKRIDKFSSTLVAKVKEKLKEAGLNTGDLDPECKNIKQLCSALQKHYNAKLLLFNSNEEERERIKLAASLYLANHSVDDWLNNP
jgi:hypothetical protein